LICSNEAYFGQRWLNEEVPLQWPPNQVTTDDAFVEAAPNLAADTNGFVDLFLDRASHIYKTICRGGWILRHLWYKKCILMPLAHSLLS